MTSVELHKTTSRPLNVRQRTGLTPLRAPFTVPIAVLQSLLVGLRRRAIEEPAWFATQLKRAGVAPALWDEPDARVTADQFVSVFLTFSKELDDELLGLLSRPLRRGSFALLARSAIGAPTVEMALRRFAHTFGLLQDDVTMTCVCEGTWTGMRLEYRRLPEVRESALEELLLRVVWRFMLWFKDGKLKPKRFDFSFSKPSYAEVYAAIFPAQARHDQPHSAVWFDSRDLDAPMRRDETSLEAFLPAAPRSLMGPRLVELPLTARVRGVLQSSRLAASLETTAQQLNMSASTLQRRLAGEANSFRKIRDEMRRDVAIQRLTTSDVPLAVLADELGFADSAAFQRAFKAWTGGAPGTYRMYGPKTWGFLQSE